MAIKIIQRGKVNREFHYKSELKCADCGTIFSCTGEDFKYNSITNDWFVECPTCECVNHNIINKTKTIAELKWTIDLIDDITISTGEVWSSKMMIHNITEIIDGYYSINTVTRNYGIRQQLIYLMK